MSPKIDYQTKNGIVESKISKELKKFTEKPNKGLMIDETKKKIKSLTRTLSSTVNN
jgi:hypothetical protein